MKDWISGVASAPSWIRIMECLGVSPYLKLMMTTLVGHLLISTQVSKSTPWTSHALSSTSFSTGSKNLTLSNRLDSLTKRSRRKETSLFKKN